MIRLRKVDDGIEVKVVVSEVCGVDQDKLEVDIAEVVRRVEADLNQCAANIGMFDEAVIDKRGLRCSNPTPPVEPAPDGVD